MNTLLLITLMNATLSMHVPTTMLCDLETFEGQVVSTNGGLLVLRTGGGEINFFVASDAIVLLDNQEVQLDDLTMDHVATVTAGHVGEKWTATRIEARSQKGASVASQPNAAPLKYQGTVERIGKNDVTVSVQGRSLSFVTSPETIILVNNIEAALEELKPGHLAKIMAVKNGDQLVAESINARREM